MVSRALGISSAGTSADYYHVMLLDEDIAAAITEVNAGDIVTSDQAASTAPQLVRCGRESLKCIFTADPVNPTGFFNTTDFAQDWSDYTYIGFMWYSPVAGTDTIRMTVTDSAAATGYIEWTEDWVGWKFLQCKLTDLITTGPANWPTAIDEADIDHVQVDLRAGFSSGTRYFDRLLVGEPYEFIPVPRLDRQLVMTPALEGKATEYTGFKKLIIDHGDNEQRFLVTSEFLDSVVGEWDYSATTKKEVRFDRLYDFLHYVGGVTGRRRWFVLWWYARCFDVALHSLTSPWRSGESNIPFVLTLLECSGV